jgi:hypothetical protein
LFTTGDWFYMMLEILVIAVSPTPWTIGLRFYIENPLDASTPAYYHVNEILILINLLRVLLILRMALMNTYWYSNRTQRVCLLYACESNYLFVIKCIMKTKPYFLIISSMIASIFFFGAALRICESPMLR